MISATSDSTAVTTSAVATWSFETTDSRRARDSASAGNASSASKAIVSRRPWPSFWWRWPPDCEEDRAGDVDAEARAGEELAAGAEEGAPERGDTAAPLRSEP